MIPRTGMGNTRIMTSMMMLAILRTIMTVSMLEHLGFEIETSQAAASGLHRNTIAKIYATE